MSLDVYMIRTGRYDDNNETFTKYVYDANITHNLNTMADKAGLYDVVWRPDENNIERAEQLIKPLEEGIAKLKADPEYFKGFNPENGWGTYEGLVDWLEKYLEACREWPKAKVEVSR